MEIRYASLSNRDGKLWLAALLFLAVGMVLTIISFLGMCSDECAEGHKWRLFGLPFEDFGMFFFAAVIAEQWASKKHLRANIFQLWLLGSGIGAEIYFIYVQKALIGTFCPVCLGIASCLLAAFMIQGFRVYDQSKKIQETTMLTKWKGFTSTTAVMLGMLIAFLGTTKYNAMEAAQSSIKENIAFGNKNSPIEVYLFTDWACPACQKLEPNLKGMIARINGEAKIFFIDRAVHPETLNYLPYHLSFILNEKPKYFELREMLTELSKTDPAPTEKQVRQEAAKYGVDYKELNYADIALATKYYKKLGEKFKVEGTPTMVIINTRNKKGKRLAGNSEITESNILKAIDTLKNLQTK